MGFSPTALGYASTWVATDQYIEISVRYHPVTVGAVTGDLRVTGDIINSPLDIPLTGTGILGKNVPITAKDYDTDLKALLLDQYKTKAG